MSDIYSHALSFPPYLFRSFSHPDYPLPSLPPFLPLPHSFRHLSLSLSPDSREESVLGSIPLPSYVISAVGPEDHISRKYAFKVRLSLFYRLHCADLYVFE